MNAGSSRKSAVRWRAVRYKTLIAAAVLSILQPPVGAETWPEVFDPLELLTLNLDVDPGDWEVVQGDLSFNIEVPARFHADGEESLLVSLRRKPGNTLGPKVSLKIDINEFEDQSWRGLKKLSLENGYETDVISEGFAWYLHRLAAGTSSSVVTST